MKTKIYISGKISGLGEVHVQALFGYAETQLINKGYDVVNPINLRHDHDRSWLSYMREDIKALMNCDAIYMLTNWKDSKGAKIEHDLAQSLGLQILYQC